MPIEIPEDVRQLARVAVTTGARHAADILLGNDAAIAYAGLDVDGVPVGVVVVAFDTSAAARLIEYAASVGGVPVRVEATGRGGENNSSITRSCPNCQQSGPRNQECSRCGWSINKVGPPRK